MIGVLIATHGELANQLIASAGMLVGNGEQIDSVCVMPGQSPDEFLKLTEEKVKALNTGDGVVALVDIVGGTPNNTLFRLSRSYPIRIVTGVNLSMVMYSIIERYEDTTLDDFIEAVQENGRNEITEFGKK